VRLYESVIASRLIGFAKNSSACNFRLLQQYLPKGDMRPDPFCAIK
jgi:hypothetical protein